MKKFAVDYSSVDKTVNCPKRYRLAEVQDKIKKVAFDVVRFIDSDRIDDLWQISRGDDGEEYIMAMYDTPAEIPVKESSDWQAIKDVTTASVNLFYKDFPAHKIKLASLNLPVSEADEFCHYLPRKLAGDKNLVASLLNDIPAEKKAELLKAYPELNMVKGS